MARRPRTGRLLDGKRFEKITSTVVLPFGLASVPGAPVPLKARGMDPSCAVICLQPHAVADHDLEWPVSRR